MTEENKNEEKPRLFLRKSGDHGGLYFFSPSGKFIYYLNAAHVVGLMNGERDFVCITRDLTCIGRQKGGDEKDEKKQ